MDTCEIQISSTLTESSSPSLTTPVTTNSSINGSDHETRTTLGSKQIGQSGTDLELIIPILVACVVAVVLVVAIVVVAVFARRRQSRRVNESRQQQKRVNPDAKKMVEQDKLIYDEVQEYLVSDSLNTVRENSLSTRMNDPLYHSTSDVIDYATFVALNTTDEVTVEDQSIYLTPISAYDVTWDPVTCREPIHGSHDDLHICQVSEQDYIAPC